MDSRAIGVYDSGVGGLTVFKILHKLLPNENYLYFGDTKNLPYGTKSKEELLKISTAIFDFFKKQNVKAVVMACNTTSSTVYEEMNEKYDFEIYPIIQTSAKCIAQNCNGNIGVMATPATIKSNKYKEELLKYNSSLDVFQQACPELVKIVESGNYETKQNLETIKSYLIPLIEKRCENIILGCTHYPYLISVFEKITTEYCAKNIKFINPAIYFTEFIKKDLTEKSLLSESKITNEKFYVSSTPEQFKESAKNFYKLSQLPELIDM